MAIPHKTITTASYPIFLVMNGVMTAPPNHTTDALTKKSASVLRWPREIFLITIIVRQINNFRQFYLLRFIKDDGPYSTHRL